MKKKFDFNFTKILHIIFAIGTIISLFIVYKNIDSVIAARFVMGYVIFLFLFIIYILLKSILNAKKLKAYEIKSRLIRFVIIFIISGLLSYGFWCILGIDSKPLEKIISTSFGLAFGICFYDLVFLRRQN